MRSVSVNNTGVVALWLNQSAEVTVTNCASLLTGLDNISKLHFKIVRSCCSSCDFHLEHF